MDKCPHPIVCMDRRTKTKLEMESAISRVLSRTVIHLGHVSPRTSSDLPGSIAGHDIASLFVVT